MKHVEEAPCAGLKGAMRREIRSRLRALSAEQRLLDSHSAFLVLEAQGAWRGAKSIAFFSPRTDEMDVWPWLAAAVKLEKAVSLPGWDAASGEYVFKVLGDLKSDLVPGRYGIPEPAEHCPPAALNSLDLILVPGVAFDMQGHRLGRGKGHYDRTLTKLHGIRCGVAYEAQLVDEIPTEPHDERLNCILTPTRWIPIPAAPARTVA